MSEKCLQYNVKNPLYTSERKTTLFCKTTGNMSRYKTCWRRVCKMSFKAPNKNVKTCFHAADEVQGDYFFFSTFVQAQSQFIVLQLDTGISSKKYQPDFLHTDLITLVFEGIQTELFNCCCLWIFVFPVCVQNDEFYQFDV